MDKTRRAKEERIKFMSEKQCKHKEVFPESYFVNPDYIYLALHCVDCDEIIVLEGYFVNKETE